VQREDRKKDVRIVRLCASGVRKYDPEIKTAGLKISKLASLFVNLAPLTRVSIETN